MCEVFAAAVFLFYGAREGEMVHERRCAKNTARVVVTLDGGHVMILRDDLNESTYMY